MNVESGGQVPHEPCDDLYHLQDSVVLLPAYPTMLLYRGPQTFTQAFPPKIFRITLTVLELSDIQCHPPQQQLMSTPITNTLPSFMHRNLVSQRQKNT